MKAGQMRVGHFESDGNAYNLILGFVPSYFKVINFNAADTEIQSIEHFAEMGDAVEIWHYMHDNDGGDDIATPAHKASGGYISEYDAKIVSGRKSVTFDYTGGASEDLLTVAGGHGFSDGERVKLTASGGLATGLSELIIYYVISSTLTTFQLSLTEGGSAVAFTSDGTAPNYVFSVDNLTAATGGKGVTIAADFMADGDEIYYVAIGSDLDTDHGDVG